MPLQQASAMRQAHKESRKIIKSYMLGRDIPDWFRGTSNFQGKAANKLNESLLYDMEQRTSHRVRACLIGLGLIPMIRNDEIKFLIKLSRANDLAFLWFLYELHYKTEGPKYSINEQLILSTIAHLDMISTLRELDRILPPGVKEEKPRKQSLSRHMIVVRPEHIRIPGKLEEVRSPYLNPIRLPKPFSTLNCCERTDFRVTLGEYDLWEDPNYVVHNEANRWFAQYEPKSGTRIVHKILNEEIANIFDDFEEAAERAQNPNIMCERHRQMIEEEKNLKRELEVIAREECRKYFDVESAKNERLRARIKAQLDKDVEMFLQKFRHCTAKVQPCECHKNEKDDILVLKGVDCFQYQKPNRVAEQPNDADRNSYRESFQNIVSDHSIAGSLRRERERGGQQDSCSDSSEESDCGKRRFSASCFRLADCDHLVVDASANNSKNNTKVPGNKKKTLRCDEDFGQLSPCSSQVYFVGAQQHLPWRFDYQKIFNTRHPYAQKVDDVKQQAAKAIDSQMGFESKMECLVKPNIDKAVRAYAKRTWRQAVQNYNEEHPDLVKNEKAQPKEKIKIPLDFKRKTYDPNDKRLMSHMLQTAFEYIKKDPKFVLASLPEAYKLPSFVYFIQNRYGKRYSLRDRHRLYLESLKILRALEKLTKKIPMPNIKHFCTNPFVSYGCRDYLLAKANQVKQDYYEELDNAIMRQARVFWFAMRPYLCTSGPPRNTYFAYMPSRSVDITRFRQWKSSEFMNAKGAWDRRQREARQKVFK